MKISQVTDTEESLIRSLYQVKANGKAGNRNFDTLVKLAARACNTHYAMLAYASHDWQYIIAGEGPVKGHIPIDHALLGDDPAEPLLVNDTLKDFRFIDNPFVCKEPGIRFIASKPVILKDNQLAGNLIVWGTKSRPLGEAEEEMLAMLAVQAAALLNMEVETRILESRLEDSRNSDVEMNNVLQRLDKQKEFYESILNKIPTDIAVFDAQHKYIFVNPWAIRNEELRKYIIGKDDFEYAAYRNRDISIAQKRRELFLEIEKSGKEIRWEDTITDPDGNPVTHLRRLFPVRNDAGELTMVIGFGIDITERKILEEKQSLIMTQISAQNTQLVDFCNIVSHNLRAPLVNMSLLVKFIEETDDEEERQLLISKLNPVIENLHTTFNELVESIQIKQDVEIKSEKNVLSEVLERTLKGLEVEIGKTKAVITSDFTEAPVISFPSKYLRSIFHNLISNTIKYQSVQRRLQVTIETRRSGDSIVLSVNDNGMGIDLVKHKDNFLKIGKVFHRNPNAKGFGLFMTKTQVEAMGGRLWAESTPEVGSTFYIEFKNQNV